MRTDNERYSAIEKLKKNKTECAKLNFFGENNHVKIDIMIDVISEKRDEEFIFNNYPSGFEDGTEDTIGHMNFCSALLALEYLRGNEEISNLLYPSINQ